MTTTARTWRRIESGTRGLHVTEGQADAIMDAITRGKEVSLHKRAAMDIVLHGGAPKEVLVTEFTDPVTGATRWAVECWSGSNKWTRDYSDKLAALAFCDRELDRLGI